MSDDALFRTLAGILFVIGASLGAYYRIKAARSGEKVSRKEEGLAVFLLLRLFGFSFLVGVLLFLIHPAWIQWSRVSIPAWLRWLGMGQGVASVAWFYWVFRSLGTNLTDTVMTRRQHTLITHGPYRWIRHPLYVGGFLSWLGFALVSTSWFLGLLSILTYAVVVARTSIEEEKLLERFGDRYRKYMETTGRFFSPAGSPLPRRGVRRRRTGWVEPPAIGGFFVTHCLSPTYTLHSRYPQSWQYQDCLPSDRGGCYSASERSLTKIAGKAALYHRLKVKTGGLEMIFWMVIAFLVGVLNFLGSPWRDGDPVMQVNGGIFLLLGLGLFLQWRHKGRKKQDGKAREEDPYPAASRAVDPSTRTV